MMVVIMTTMVMLRANCVRCKVPTDMILRIHVRPFLRNFRKHQTLNTKDQTPNKGLSFTSQRTAQGIKCALCVNQRY